jgi:thioesterase domain-containing protein
VPDNFAVRRLQALLHEQIPLAREMQAELLQWGEGGLEMVAPLEPNLNHHGTFFGGSASALGILAGWSLVHLLTMEEGMEVAIVIQRVAIRYSAPAPGPLLARADLPTAAAWDRFLAVYRRRGLARLRVRVTLLCEGERVAVVDASYAATAHT